MRVCIGRAEWRTAEWTSGNENGLMTGLEHRLTRCQHEAASEVDCEFDCGVEYVQHDFP